MAKSRSPTGNINTFIDRMLAKREKAGGEIQVAPPSEVHLAALAKARTQLAAMPARERDRTSLAGLVKQIEAKQAGRSQPGPIRIDLEKLLAKRIGTPAEKAIEKALGIAPPLPTVARQGTLTGAPLGSLDLVGRMQRLTGDIRADQAIQDRQRGSGGGAAAQATGIVIAEEFRAPHTLRTKTGKNCRTDRWFDRCGLCYDAGLDPDAKGGANNPMLWVGGTSFRVYYPRSTKSDFASMFSSGSTGRWLNQFSQRSNYVNF